jgi:hypothetical protein
MRTRTEQIAAIRADQLFWRGLAAEIGPERYSEPGPMGEWSFGDMAGHLLGWRNRTLARLVAFAQGEPDPADPWPSELDADDDVDAINAWIQDHQANRSPAQLVDDYDNSFDRLVAIMETIPETKLVDPGAIPFVGGPLVDVDFGGHLHDEHVPGVRAWLAQRSAGAAG